MKEYDLISIGTGSAMSVVSGMIRRKPRIKVAIIEKDEPGGICLTRGCIPSKLLLYPAELIRATERAEVFGIEIDIKKIDFSAIMERMRSLIYKDINRIRQALSHSRNVDYYPSVAQFVGPYTLKVDGETIRSKMIFLCTGSKPAIPPIEGIERISYLTSDTVLNMSSLPESIAIVGGGYIAAEYGHFFSAMGSNVTVIGRNPQFLPQEEPEVSDLARRELSKHILILTNHEVQRVHKTGNGKKKLVAVDRKSGEERIVTTSEVLIASGRGPNTNILHPENAGIRTDKSGWIVVDDYLETSQPNVWGFGDANGKAPFKHAANYEAKVVYYNAVLKEKMKMDYHAVPHAVFTYPEIASVGLKEKEAIAKYGNNNVLIGFQRYEDTAKGEAMAIKDCFAKLIIEKHGGTILGAHIIGPYASILVQEIVNQMFSSEQSVEMITRGMHIHPALSEVVDRAASSLMSPEEYHHLAEHQRSF